MKACSACDTAWDTVHLSRSFNKRCISFCGKFKKKMIWFGSSAMVSVFPGCSLSCGTQMTSPYPGRSCFRGSKVLMLCSACWQRRLMQSCWMLQVCGHALSQSSDESNEKWSQACVFMFDVLLQVQTWRSSVLCRWVLTISLWRRWRKGDSYLSTSLRHIKVKSVDLCVCLRYQIKPKKTDRLPPSQKKRNIRTPGDICE